MPNLDTIMMHSNKFGWIPLKELHIRALLIILVGRRLEGLTLPLGHIPDHQLVAVS